MIPPALFYVRILGLALLMGISTAQAQSVGSRGASAKVSLGTAAILASPAASVAGSANGNTDLGALLAVTGMSFAVSSVAELSADTTEIIIESIDGTLKASVRVSTSAINGLNVSTGAAVQALTASTGTVLVTSGNILAFIPSALGQTLLHHERVPG